MSTVIHLHAAATDWWTRCSLRVHPSRSTTDVADVTCNVTCKKCLRRAGVIR